MKSPKGLFGFRLLIVASLFSFASYTSLSAAQSLSWDAGGGDDNWSTGTNWVGDAAPATGDNQTNLLWDFTGPLSAGGAVISNNDLGAAMQVDDLAVNVRATDGDSLTISDSASPSDLIFVGVDAHSITTDAQANVFTWTINNDIQVLDNSLGIAPTNTLHTIRLNGAISSAGFDINKAGAGTLCFGGANAYSGATNVTAGTLKAEAANTFSENSLHTVSIGAVLNLNSVDQSIGDLAGDGLVLLGSSTLTVGNAAGSGVTYTGGISGTGGVTKVGAEEWEVGGATKFYMGPTTISGGEIKLLGDNVLPTATSLIIDTGAFLDLFANDQKVRTLTGSGTVKSDSDGAGESILRVDSNTDATFDGVITQVSSDNTVSFVKDGANTVTFTGDHTYGGKQNTATGSTTVNAGKFLVNGSIQSDTITVNGGILGGTGALGVAAGGNYSDVVINSGATHAPGNSIGTQNVVGSYTLNAGATLEIEIAPTEFDLVQVSGVPGFATIAAGGIFNFVDTGAAGNFTDGQTFPFLTSTGLLTDSGFVHTPATIRGFTTSVACFAGPPGDCTLTLTGIPLTQRVPGGNPLAVANCLSMLSGGDFDTINAALMNIGSNDALNIILNSMHPAQYADMSMVSKDNSTLVGRHTCRHVGQLKNGFLDTHSGNLWVDILGGHKENHSNGNYVGYRGMGAGVVVGADIRLVPEDLLVGIVGSFMGNDFKWKSHQGEGNSYDLIAGFYTCWMPHPFFVNASILGGAHEFRGHRHVAFADIDRKMYQDHRGWGVSGQIEGGFNMFLDDFDVQPFAGVAYSFMSEQDFQERGENALAVHVDRHKSDLLRSEAGFTIARTFLFGNYLRWVHSLRISYVNKINIYNTKMAFQFPGAGDCVVSGYHKPVHFLAPGLAITLLDDGRGLVATVYYDGEIGHRRINNNFGLRVQKRF